MIGKQPLHLVRRPGQWNTNRCLTSNKTKGQRDNSSCTVKRRWGANFVENKITGQKSVKLQRQSKQIVTRSRSHSNLEKQNKHCAKQIELKEKEGYELIKNKDRPSKLKTVCNQILKFDISLEKLLDKRGDIFNNLESYRRHKTQQPEFFINLEADWLPYIHGQTSMADQQNQTPLQSRAAEPNDKVPRSMGETSQVSVKNQQKDNQDKESRASSDKRAKKAEKLAALDKEFNTKMRLRKIEYEMKQKELEMELHRLEEEGALKLQYEKEALDARDSSIRDSRLV